MNIIAQCCGIALMLVILYFYQRQKKIRLKTGDAFCRALCVTLLCVMLDIVSIVAIDKMEQLPRLLVEIICKSYLVSLIGVGLCGLLYVYVDIYSVKRKKYQQIVYGFLTIAVLGALLVYCLPLYYYNNGNVAYTYGPSVLTTYLFALFFVGVTLVTTIWQKKRLNPRRREAVLLWMVLWMGTSVIQFFNNRLLLVGFGSSIGIMILYLMLENPETNLDRRTGLFNQNALLQYIKQLNGKQQKFSVLVLVLEHSNSRRLSIEAGQIIRLEMASFLSAVPGALCFKNDEDETILLFEDSRRAEEAIPVIQRRFESGWGQASVFMPLSWIYVPDSDMAQEVEDIIYLVRYVRQNNKEFLENHSVVIDEKVITKMWEEKQVEKLIVDAMEQGRVEVFYQPIYSTKEGCFTSAEALVRIRDENDRIVPPGIFIDIAEKNGMILRLGAIIFEQVCCFLRENDLKKYGIHYIEINLSVVQCAYEQLAENYIRIMQKYNISPSLINLEITESASLNKKKVLLENMKKLMDYGVRFSLDDFGTGQSNLNYIIDMPVDIVKFDRVMSNAYFENGKAKYVMDAAMHMVHGLGLEIVSEGIETKEQYQTMEELGISYIQGYYFSKPLAAGDFLTFLQANAK